MSMEPSSVGFQNNCPLMAKCCTICTSKTCQKTLARKIKHLDKSFAVDPHSPGPKVIKLLSCSTQQGMKFKKLINTEIAKIN